MVGGDAPHGRQRITKESCQESWGTRDNVGRGEGEIMDGLCGTVSRGTGVPPHQTLGFGAA